METKTCESCGMPMKKTEDFGGGNSQNKYCRFCTNNQGELKPYEEKVNDFKNLLMKTQDLNESKALTMAKEALKQFPAWKDV